MKSSFGPKYHRNFWYFLPWKGRGRNSKMSLWNHRLDQNTNENFALVLSGQKLSNFLLVFWSKRWLHKDILKLTDLYFCLIYFEWTLKWKYLLRLLPPFKIVQLIRDPRGIMASIFKGNKLNFKEYRKNILNGKFCEMMINDSNLEQHLPSNR